MTERSQAAAAASRGRWVASACLLGLLALLIRFGLTLPATAEVQLNDFAGYWGAARVVAEGAPERLYDPDRKWFTNLPVVAWALVPLAALDYDRAWQVFWALQVASLAACFGVVLLLVARHFPPLTAARALAAGLLLLCFAPVMRRCLTLGQTTPFVALLLALFQLAVHEGWRKLGGALLGLACLIKIPPLLLVFGMGLRRRLDVAGAALAVVGLGVALSVAGFGGDLVEQYAQRVIVDNLGRSEAAFNNRSLDGAFMRALTDHSLLSWDTVPRPLGVTLAVGSSVAGLLALLWWRGGSTWVWPRRAPQLEPPEGDPFDLELAIGAALSVLVFPVVWIHYYLFLAVPCAVLPFWWRARRLPLGVVSALLLAAGLWLASGSEVHGNHTVGRHQHEPGFRHEQNLQPLGAVLLVVGLGAPLAAIAGDRRRDRLR
ncbi:MAG: DUF2029 domain-containing protein [Deltaproteobacteria bacterium]|nr:DUF2029 domain-containing protein [Deltaproteobacteria bacterium]